MVASPVRVLSVRLLLRVLRRGEERALAAPARAPGPRFLTLRRLHLLLRLLLVLLALRSLVARSLALILIQIELEVCTLFYRVVEVDVCFAIRARAGLVLVPVVDHIVLICAQVVLARVQERLASIISCVVRLLHEVVPLDLLAELAASCALALPGIAEQELLFECLSGGRPDPRRGGPRTRTSHSLMFADLPTMIASRRLSLRRPRSAPLVLRTETARDRGV